jgi:hypothetical protein
MPLWAKYDRANGRIVAITDAPVAPPEEGPIGIIECGSGAKVGDFIPGSSPGTDPEGAQEPEQDLTPDDPFSDPSTPQPKE